MNSVRSEIRSHDGKSVQSEIVTHDVNSVRSEIRPHDVNIQFGPKFGRTM